MHVFFNSRGHHHSHCGEDGKSLSRHYEHMSHLLSTRVIVPVTPVINQFMPAKSDTKKTMSTHNELNNEEAMYTRKRRMAVLNV